MAAPLAIGNIGIGNTSTLATLNNHRFLIVDDKELAGNHSPAFV